MQEYTDGTQTVEAWQVTCSSADSEALLKWMDAGGYPDHGSDRILREGGIVLATAEGLAVIPPGDWVIKRGQGDFAREDAASFESTFKPV